MGTLRLSLAFLLTMLPVGLGSCVDPDPESGILVNVQRESGDFDVDKVEIRGYADGRLFDALTNVKLSPDGQALGQSFNFFVWVPPAWIGQTVWLDITGFYLGARTSHGQVSVVPVDGRIEEVTILLKQGAPNCGNGICDEGELCEATELAGQTCANTVGLSDGQLSCTDCQLDTSDCHDCGNGRIEAPAEGCDGSELDGATCQTMGFVQGELRCGGDCQLDLSRCEQGCGNGVIEDLEVCDGTNLDGMGCPDFDFQRGYLLCGADCQFDSTNCAGICGDGTLDPGESCDGSDFGDQNCLISAGRYEGVLTCTSACHLDVSGCFTCGDGAIEGPEQCDGLNLGGADCASLPGFSSGTLTCDVLDCQFDTSGCQ